MGGIHCGRHLIDFFVASPPRRQKVSRKSNQTQGGRDEEAKTRRDFHPKKSAFFGKPPTMEHKNDKNDDARCERLKTITWKQIIFHPEEGNAHDFALLSLARARVCVCLRVIFHRWGESLRGRSGATIKNWRLTSLQRLASPSSSPLSE